MNGAGKHVRLHPASRLALLGLFSLGVLLVDSLPALVFCQLAAVAVFLAARPKPRSLLLLLGMSLATIWGFAVTQGIFYPFRPRTIVWELAGADLPVIGSFTGGITLYREGLVYGCVQSLRFMALLTAGLTLVLTTSAQELLAGLRRLRVPYAIAFMAATAVRFVPAIARETRSVLDAMQVRGKRLGPTRFWRYAPAIAQALPAILSRNVRRATTLADAVESKGFAVRSEDADGGNGPIANGERAVLGFVLVLVVSLSLLKFFAYLSTHVTFFSFLPGWISDVAHRYF